jgi:hypothetical protein
MIVVMTVFIATQAISQDRSVRWGSLVEEGYRTDRRFLGKEKATGISYWLYNDKHGVWLSSFGRNNNRLRNDLIDYTKTGLTHVPAFRDAIYIHGKIYLLVSAAGKLYFHQLNRNGKVIGNLTPVADDGNVFYDATFRSSPDSTQLLIFSHFLNARNNEHSESFTFIDPTNSNVIDNRVIKALPGLELERNWNFVLRDLTVDNAGNVVFETQLIRKRIRLPQYWLFRQNENSPREIQVPRGEMTIGNVALKADTQGRILFVGFFSWNNIIKRNTKPGGVLFGHVDVVNASIPDLKITEMNDNLSTSHPITYKFDNELRSQIKDDGGVILLTEQVYVDSRNYAKSDNVHVVSLDSTGSIVYNVSVPTKQRLRVSLYTKYIDLASTSYFHMYDANTGDLNLIYNSNKRNVDSLSIPVASLTVAKTAVPVLATIRGDGEIKYEVIDRKQSTGILMEPITSWQISSTQAILLGEKDKKWSVGTLSLGIENQGTLSENVDSEEFVVTQSKSGVHLKRVTISPLPAPNLLYLGLAPGYSTIPKNNFNDWLNRNNISIPDLNKPVPDLNLMFLLAIKNVGAAIEFGGDNRKGVSAKTYNSTLTFGFSLGYHNYFSKGRHFLLLGTIGGSLNWFDFYNQPNGPANITNANSYTIHNDKYYVAISAKIFKTTGWLVGAGIDAGIRYHFRGNWWYFNDSDPNNRDISYLNIPQIQGLSFYINFPIGFCLDGRRQRRY